MPRLASVLATTALIVAPGGGVLAAEPSPATTEEGSSWAAGQRVEASDLGVVVTVPPDWSVEDVYGEVYATSPTGVTCMPTGSRLDEPVPDPDALVDEVAAFYPHFFDDGPPPVVDQTEVTLPAGRSVRLVVDRALYPDPARMEEGRYLTTYFISDGRVLAFFSCSGDERPADDWLHIAETLEFPPAEE